MAKTVDETALRRLLGIQGAVTAVPRAHTRDARHLSSLDGFNIKRPPIPSHTFLAERDRALAPRTPTGLIPLDLSRILELPGPATTPLILAHYAKIRGSERLRTAFRASTELYYVIRGAGTTTFGPGGGQTLAWGRPSRQRPVLATHLAGAVAAVLALDPGYQR